MKIQDFMKYFSNLTIARSVDPTFLEVRYFASFAPSFGSFTTKS